MFRLAERLSSASPQQKRHLQRALLFAAGLALLWLAVQLLPPSAPPTPHPLYSDESGTVAAKTDAVQFRREPRLLTPGTFFAFVLLAGGGAFALHLRRRRRLPGTPAALIEPVATYPLAAGQQLRLVRCADEVLLLGVTSAQITLLKTYPGDTFDPAGSVPYEDPTAYPAAPPAATRPDLASSPFADVLRHHARQHAS